MKALKIIITIVCIMMLTFIICSCTKQSLDEELSKDTQTGLESNEPQSSDEHISTIDENMSDLDGLEHVLALTSNPIYNNVQLANNSSTGEAQTYEELVQTLYEMDRPFNFVKLKIIGKYTPEDAFNITGNNMFLTSATLFQAVITYDCLNDEEMYQEINLAQSGNDVSQNKGNPLYSIGDEYCAYLLNSKKEGWWIAGELCFAIHNVNNINLAYQMSSENIRLVSDKINIFEFKNLSLEMSDGERSVVTTTNNNPVEYSYKMTEIDLIKFIRSDWQARGFDLTDFETIK